MILNITGDNNSNWIIIGSSSEKQKVADQKLKSLEASKFCGALLEKINICLRSVFKEWCDFGVSVFNWT